MSVPRLSRSAGQGRPAAQVRLVHLGLGNFFRAHQCWYTQYAPDAANWGIAAFTGGITGMLLALNSGVDSTMPVIGLKAFPAALVGGLDSLWGALLGALIVAGAEVLLIQYVDPLLSDVVPFFVLLAVLAVRPWGLFGSREQLDRV